MNSPFAIVKGALLPAHRNLGRVGTYPFSVMVVNDAFFVPIVPPEDAVTVSARVRSAAGGWTRRHKGGVRFSVRATVHPDTKEPCVGVYAMAPRA